MKNSSEQIERVRSLWEQACPPLSASEIADKLCLTKNQVIGIAHRNGFSARQSPLGRICKTLPSGSEALSMALSLAGTMTHARIAKKITAAGVRVTDHDVGRALRKAGIRRPEPVPLEPLEAEQPEQPDRPPQPVRPYQRPPEFSNPTPAAKCCWSFGDRGNRSYCDADVVYGGKPYCVTHYSEAYVCTDPGLPERVQRRIADERARLRRAA